VLDTSTGAVVFTAKGDLDVQGDITVSGTVDGIDIATDVAANTAKLTADWTNVAAALAAASGDVDVNSQKITNLGAPSAATDVPSKGYVDGAIEKPEMVSVGAAHTDTVAVAFKVVDGNGDDVAKVTPVTWWLSSSATTGVLHGTAPDGGVTYTTGSKLADHTAHLFGEAITDANGDAAISLNHVAGAQDYYLWLRVGDTTVTSTKIEITA
jgi:hypothetical protein